MKIRYSPHTAAVLADMGDVYSREAYTRYVQLLGYDPLVRALDEHDSSMERIQQGLWPD